MSSTKLSNNPAVKTPWWDTSDQSEQRIAKHEDTSSAPEGKVARNCDVGNERGD